MRFQLKGRLLAVVATALAAACSKTTTSLTAPSFDKCQVSVRNTPSAFAASGGQGSLAIVTARDCTWAIDTQANWVTIIGDRGGQGDASVSYAVSKNPLPSSRTGSISVGSQSVALSQAPAPCGFKLSRTGDAVAAAGGPLSVNVSALEGCRWDATTPVPWVAVTSGRTGNGRGTVELAVAPNTGSARSAALKIAGRDYQVAQAATPPSVPGPLPSPQPTPQPTPPPNPPPAPQPAPQPSERVDFSGRIARVSGRCPNVTFTVNDMTIVVDRSTDFKKSDCGDVRDGRTVSGAGRTQANGTVRATDLRVKQDDDDDDDDD